ncbi:uncharacterized protein LOC133722884 [Rosa rugosa]|uniref:uncharacterized protein LOC133722884 n=1 Tax=Rosa rugosa TaxID=74645 RepID=UPI002B413060|nr:uncharacterized protein LOC133722884 [Rosa rugosa]
MVWHSEKRPRDGVLRHPADSLAWKELDKIDNNFGSDGRNVRLGLASDGFNPFGPKSPGNDIDVYLQPLIDELKMLWAEGVPTYDAFKKEVFQMRVALLWSPYCLHQYLSNSLYLCYLSVLPAHLLVYLLHILNIQSVAQEISHGKEPDRWELFKLTHQRKGSQEPIDVASAKPIADFEEAEQKRLSMNVDITAPEIREEMYAEVLGKEKGNRVRGVGAGVTWDEVPGIHVEERGVSREVKQLREQLEEQAKKAQEKEAHMMEELQSKMVEQTKRMEQMFEVRCVEMALQKRGEMFKQCGISVDTQEDVMQMMSQFARDTSQRPSTVAFSPDDDVYRPTMPFDCPNMQID